MTTMQGSDLSQWIVRSLGPFRLRGYRVPRSGSIYELLAELGRHWSPILAVNLRKAALPPSTWLAAELDLYRDVLESIRQEHSLHFIGPEAAESWLEVFEQFRIRGALIVIFTDKSREELVAGLKLYLAWYASPIALKVQLEEGSDHLRRALMTGVQAILLQASPEDDWVLYMAPGVDLPTFQAGPPGQV